MVLPPIEFYDCYLDSPWFRENVHKYEVELERTNSQIKQLIKDAKSMINAFKAQAKTMKLFNLRLQNFQFDCIGENLTDDEKLIAGSLKEFGLMLEELSSEWKRTIERAELQLIHPLEGFRKEHIYSFRESKKCFEKASDRYYKQLEHTLSLSHKKKEQQLQDSDNELQNLRKAFHSESLQYVYKLQEVQERKKFEFVENLLMFMQVYFNYLHQTHETATDYKEYMKELQMRLVATRDTYHGTQDQTMALMGKMAAQPDGNNPNPRWSRAGYLFLMEKNSISARLASKWTKYFCMYTKETKLFQIMSPHHTSSSVTSSVNTRGSSSSFSNSGSIEPWTMKTCTRRITDTIDKRFCFDLELEDVNSQTANKDQNGRLFTFTFQAVSELDRKKWLTVMDGKEPQYVPNNAFTTKRSYGSLNEQGLHFINDLIEEIERRGVDHEGIYRLVGVTSKVDNLLRQALNSNDSVDLSNCEIVETNTMTSALKSYLRNLPEPLMTFNLHRSFIDAAKCEHHSDRVMRIATLVAQLPDLNRRMLAALMQHLEKVQEHNEKNKMTIQNLGVCFGPTLLRDKEESVQAIMEIKFSNIIVEILLEEQAVIFRDDNDNNNVNESLDNLPSPRVHSKTATRLPSQRLKQRPRGGIFDQVTPIAEIDENEISAHFGENAPRAREILLNSQSDAPPSPSLDLDSQDRTSRCSASSDDSLQLSPMDLDLGFKEFAETPANKTPSPEEDQPAPLAKADSMNSMSEVSKVSNPSITSDELTLDPPAPELDRGDKNGLVVPESIPKKSAPQPKLRISLRRGKHSTKKKKDSWRSSSHNKNNNNNNNTPTVRPKPRTLAMPSSIKGARKKFVSAKEGFINNIGTKKQTTPVCGDQPYTDFRKPSTSLEDSPFTDRRMRSRHVNSIESTSPIELESKVDSIETSPKAEESAGSEIYDVSLPRSSQVVRPSPYEIPMRLSASDAEKAQSLQTASEMQVKSVSDTNQTESSTTPYEIAIPNVLKCQRPSETPARSDTTECQSSETSRDSVTEPQQSNYESPLCAQHNIPPDEVLPSMAKTLFACQAEHESELSFEAGQMIRDIRSSDEDGWIHGCIGDKVGLIPKNYIEFIES